MENVWDTAVMPMIKMLNKLWVTVWDYLPELLPLALAAFGLVFVVKLFARLLA